MEEGRNSTKALGKRIGTVFLKGPGCIGKREEQEVKLTKHWLIVQSSFGAALVYQSLLAILRARSKSRSERTSMQLFRVKLQNTEYSYKRKKKKTV
jgi:hypothetical protein